MSTNPVKAEAVSIAEAVTVEAFADLDQLEPGELFELTWAFRNEGQQAWEDMALVYTDDSFPETTMYPHTNLAGRSHFPLTELGASSSVAPGDTAYLTVEFTAPADPGIYMTGWQLRTAAGERFGPVREVRVIVVEPSIKGLDEHRYEKAGFQNSVPDVNNVPPGQPFTCTWTLRNAGIHPWSGDFKVVATAEGKADIASAVFNPMGAPEQINLRDLTGRETIPPGATATLPMNFTAPDTPGIYAFYWQLVDAAGQPFGGTRWMRIIVKSPPGAAPTPPPAGTYAYRGPAVTFFTGIHGPADDWMWNDGGFKGMMERLNLPVFFWSHGSNGDNAGFGDKSKNAVRLYWNPRPVSADEGFDEVRDDQLKHWWNRGYRRFIFFNEPQFGKEIAKIEEGMGISWHNKEQFGAFVAQCLRRARHEFPGIKLFTTPMSSNEAFDPWGWRATMWAHVQGLVDGWCMHAYSGDNGNADAAADNIAGQVIELQHRFRLQIPIIVSEASVNRGSDAQQKARVAHILHDKLSRVPGVEGVFWYAADWNPDFDQHHEGWFRNGIADAYIQQRGG